RRRLARRARTSAIALSPAVAFMLAGLRADSGRSAFVPAEDPPTLTFRFDDGILSPAERPAKPTTSSQPAHRHVPVHRVPAVQWPRVHWHHAESLGLPYGGSLVDATQLPFKGPNWVTWNPITDSSPNLPKRLYGNERTIHAIISVTRAYRAAH